MAHTHEIREGHAQFRFIDDDRPELGGTCECGEPIAGGDFGEVLGNHARHASAPTGDD